MIIMMMDNVWMKYSFWNRYSIVPRLESNVIVNWVMVNVTVIVSQCDSLTVAMIWGHTQSDSHSQSQSFIIQSLTITMNLSVSVTPWNWEQQSDSVSVSDWVWLSMIDFEWLTRSLSQWLLDWLSHLWSSLSEWLTVTSTFLVYHSRVRNPNWSEIFTKSDHFHFQVPVNPLSPSLGMTKLSHMSVIEVVMHWSPTHSKRALL